VLLNGVLLRKYGDSGPHVLGDHFHAVTGETLRLKRPQVRLTAETVAGG
jgi:hypothetical protein